MSRLPTKLYADDLLRRLREYEGMEHLRVRAHGETLTLESGTADDPVRHARFKRDTVHLWLLEVANHTGRWSPTALRAPLLDLADILVNQFGWVLEPIGGPWEPGKDLGS